MTKSQSRAFIVISFALFTILTFFTIDRVFADEPDTVRTLILTNRTQLDTLYGSTETDDIMSQLDLLAAHTAVSGIVVEVDKTSIVAEAYTEWQSDLTSSELANAVTDAIYDTVIQTLHKTYPNLEYILLVGDDRVIPFRRIPDPTAEVRPNITENDYDLVSQTTTVGAALAEDMVLMDDFYVQQESFYGSFESIEMSEIFYPSKSIGRLVETPAEIKATIEKFLTNDGKISVSNGLIFGDEFLLDAAQNTCDQLSDVLSPSQITPTCILSDTWGAEALRTQLQGNEAEVVFFYTHGDHYRIGTPTIETIESETDWRTLDNTRLIFSMNDHSGLNVPPNSTEPYDWPQAHMSRGDIYISNIGYAWGFISSIGLSERLGTLFSEKILDQPIKSVGQALLETKLQYIAEESSLSAYDKKVVAQLVLYGLPMYEVVLPLTTTSPESTATPSPTLTPSPTPTLMPDLPEEDAWGIMIYLNGDNDLSRWTRNLFNELELAVFHDPSLRIRVLWDLQRDGDTVLYQVQPDNSQYGLADYQEGTTKWSQGELNMGDPDTLLNFILTSRQELSTERYQLSIVDHGGGWSPSLPAGQPPGRRWAAGASGFSWDWTDGYSYLSTEDMGYIFSHPQLVQDPIDVVFYDACLMAMLEEAFEIREGVHYLVASQNETFTTFPYSRYLENLESRSPREQAVWLVDNYYESLERDQYARTLSVLDLQQADELKNAVNTFATMIGAILALKDERITTEYIRQIFPTVQKLDYNFDLIIEDTEGYVDLGDFVSRIIADLSGSGTSEIVQAGEKVLDALKDGQNPFVIYERHASGYTGYFTKAEVDNVTGLSVYLPFGEDDPDLPFYLNSQIDYVTEGFWDEFILLYLGPFPQSGISDSVGGRGNRPGPITIGDNSIYMPLIIK